MPAFGSSTGLPYKMVGTPLRSLTEYVVVGSHRPFPDMNSSMLNHPTPASTALLPSPVSEIRRYTYYRVKRCDGTSRPRSTVLNVSTIAAERTASSDALLQDGSTLLSRPRALSPTGWSSSIELGRVRSARALCSSLCCHMVQAIASIQCIWYN